MRFIELTCLCKHVQKINQKFVLPWCSGRDYLIQQSLNSGSCAGSNPARGVSEICDGKNL